MTILGGSTNTTNPLWHEQKVKNYLPDMTWPEVQDPLAPSDMVIIPAGAAQSSGPGADRSGFVSSAIKFIDAWKQLRPLGNP